MHSQQTYRVTVGSDSTLCRRWAQETSFGGRAGEARDDLTAKGLMGVDVKANVGLCKRTEFFTDAPGNPGALGKQPRSRTMLILTRRVGETIRINDDISIQVLSVSGQQVKIGITAPDDVVVHREEVYMRIQAQREVGDAA